MIKPAKILDVYADLFDEDLDGVADRRDTASRPQRTSKSEKGFS
jgi:hypothetical protein